MKYTYEIRYDDLAENPRDFHDNLSTFYAVRDFRSLTGGKTGIEFFYRDDLEDEIKALRKAGAIVVEFSCNAGEQYAVVKRDRLYDEYIKHGYTRRKALYHARRCIKGEIYEWQAWANGKVYGYVVKDENDETVDYCWRFYGESGRKAAIEDAKSFIVWKMEDDIKQARLINVSFAE